MSGTLFLHAAQIATPAGKKAAKGADMGRLRVIEDGAVLVESGRIRLVGATEEVLAQINPEDYEVVDASGRCLVPGFVDAHTHFVFAGARAEEFALRLKGAPYLDILRAGGGILSTMRATRAASEEALYRLGRERLDEMLAQGVTTAEGKSGYGLDLDTELTQLEVMARLNREHPVDVAATFLGAHAIPPEYAGDEAGYVDFMIETVLPRVAERGLAQFCDAFCEEGVFSPESARRLLTAARRLGLSAKLHADEIVSLGGAELAAELGAASADHLLAASPAGIEALARGDTVATLLPLTAFCLHKPYAPARAMIDRGCAVALATDLNPGSCYSGSIPLLIALAALEMRMTPEETLTALTLNGAAALGRAGETGSIEPGKRADILMLNEPGYLFLTYHTARNIVRSVYKDGIPVHPAGRAAGKEGAL